MKEAVDLQGGSHPNPLKRKPQILDTELQAFMFAVLGFRLALVQYLLSIPHFSFLSGNIYNMYVPWYVGCIFFKGLLGTTITLSLKRDFVLLNNVETVKDQGHF